MGFCLVDRLAENHGIGLSRRGFESVYGQGKIIKEKVILAKPLTFMNLSGEAVQRLLQFFKIQPESLIVLHDDLDLPWGKIRIRLRGGDGGHQGVRSICETLGTNEFVRLKVGIGRPREKNQDPSEYVLEPVKGKDREEFREAVQKGVEAVEVLLIEGPEEAMNHFHRRHDE